MGFVNGIEQWLLRVAVQKALKRGIPWILTALGVALTHVNQTTGQYGITVNLDTAAAAAGVAVGLGVVQNWLKNKLGVTWL